MNPTTFAALLVGAAGLFLVAFNHLTARLSLVEVMMNEGLPPGHATADRNASDVATTGSFESGRAREMLPTGVHLFLSRSCFACQRLAEELDGYTLAQPPTPVSVHYIDRPFPASRSTFEDLGLSISTERLDLIEALRIDPLPHTVAIGPHDLVVADVTPTVRSIRDVAEQAALTSPFELAST